MQVNEIKKDPQEFIKRIIYSEIRAIRIPNNTTLELRLGDTEVLTFKSKGTSTITENWLEVEVSPVEEEWITD